MVTCMVSQWFYCVVFHWFSNGKHEWYSNCSRPTSMVNMKSMNGITSVVFHWFSNGKWYLMVRCKWYPNGIAQFAGLANLNGKLQCVAVWQINKWLRPPHHLILKYKARRTLHNIVRPTVEQRLGCGLVGPAWTVLKIVGSRL